MAHFAKLNNNIVVDVIVVNNDVITNDQGVESEELGIVFLKSLFGEDSVWKQTSYNGNIRKNYAGIGYQYDSNMDAFIPPKPFNSWVLDENSCQWKAPIDKPDNENFYNWDEQSQTWIQYNI